MNASTSIERKRTITAENACIHGDTSSDQDIAIHHGDSNEKETSCLLINIYSPSTLSGKQIPPPWSESRTLSPSHIAITGELKVNFDHKSEILKIDGKRDITGSTIPTGEFADNPNARYLRLQQANEDTHNLHLKTVQTGSGSMDFARLLDPKSGEVVTNQLACKCILNLNTFGDSTFDIMGDCKLIMTEYSQGTSKQRKLYLFQVCQIFWPVLILLRSHFKLLFDRQDLSSWAWKLQRTLNEGKPRKSHK
jgi:hypothetical protein